MPRGEITISSIDGITIRNSVGEFVTQIRGGIGNPTLSISSDGTISSSEALQSRPVRPAIGRGLRPRTVYADALTLGAEAHRLLAGWYDERPLIRDTIRARHVIADWERELGFMPVLDKSKYERIKINGKYEYINLEECNQ